MVKQITVDLSESGTNENTDKIYDMFNHMRCKNERTIDLYEDKLTSLQIDLEKYKKLFEASENEVVCEHYLDKILEIKREIELTIAILEYAGELEDCYNIL